MTRRALLCSIAFCSFAAANAAHAAQAPDPVEPVPTAEDTAAQAEEASGEANILVTGSRIARQEFVSTRPVITSGRKRWSRPLR